MVKNGVILCPVDFFPVSQHAARYAIRLAKRDNAKLILLHVIEPIGPWVPGARDGDLITRAIKKTASERLLDIANQAKAAQVPVTALVRIGEVVTVIRSVVAKTHANLVVVGTHGRNRVARLLLGSTALHLLRQLRVPVLTIHDVNVNPARQIRHILLITDLLHGTTEAVARAAALATEYGARLTLLHVFHDVQDAISGVYRLPLIQGIRRQLKEMVPSEARNTCSINVRILRGRPRRRVLPWLEREKVDLVVMNIHEKTLMDWLMLGSFAGQIISESPVPVMSIPAATRAQHHRSRAA